MVAIEHRMLLRDRKQLVKEPETLADGTNVIEVSKSHVDPTKFSSKEQSIWERLREEHHETIDQLPLTLTRQMALLQELDRRSDALGSQILPMLHAYSIKRNLTGISEMEYVPTLSRQEALSRVAKLSEDALRMSEEKMYLAQAAQDIVERHVRILEQASHEIEAIVSSDHPLGLNPAPFTLPDLSVPRWAKQSRVIDSSEDESTPEVYPQAGLEAETEKTSRKKGSKKSTHQKGNSSQQPLKILLRGTAPSTVQEDVPVDARTYCYCDSGSFGEMIACDNSKCQREWFHLGCAGLTVPPEGKWFCKDCSPGKKRKRTH